MQSSLAVKRMGWSNPFHKIAQIFCPHIPHIPHVPHIPRMKEKKELREMHEHPNLDQRRAHRTN